MSREKSNSVSKTRDELIADFRRKHKENEMQKGKAAQGDRETVIGSLRDQYRQF